MIDDAFWQRCEAVKPGELLTQGTKTWRVSWKMHYGERYLIGLEPTEWRIFKDCACHGPFVPGLPLPRCAVCGKPWRMEFVVISASADQPTKPASADAPATPKDT